MVATSPELIAFYESKTQGILRRYGPGPRVHYHTGLLEDECINEPDPSRIRGLLVQSQEDLLHYAAKVWRIDSGIWREILDVGCGLGGGSLFWAMEFGIRVTALTIVPSHAELVRQFAAQAGLSQLVIPISGDALAIEGENRFDAAIAIDSSSSFPRAAWFRQLSKVLRPSRRVLIADCFLVDPKYEEPFNSHWYAQIGTLKEYIGAANAAGFREEKMEDLSTKAQHFWSLSLAEMSAESKTSASDAIPPSRVSASRRIHRLVRDGLASGGLRYLLLAFS